MSDEFIPASVLDEISDVMAGFRSDICVLQRRGSSRDVGGAPAGGYVAAGRVRCRLESGSAAERIAGGRYGPELAAVAVLPRGTIVDVNTRIIWRGRTYDVIADPSGTLAAEVAVPVRSLGGS